MGKGRRMQVVQSDYFKMVGIEDIKEDVMRYIWSTIMEELCISITCLLVSEIPFKGRKYLVCCIAGPQ